MINSKFIRLYKTITASEKRLLKKWIYSPIHNKHQHVQQLFEFLFSRESLSSVTLQKERAFQYIFPKQAYDMDLMNHIISYSYKILENFIEFLEAVQNDSTAIKNQIQAYSKRKFKKIALKKWKLASKQLQQSPHQNAAYYYESYALEALYFQIEGTQSRTKANNLPILFEQVSNFYIITMLRYACISVTHSNVYKTNYQIPLLDAILKQAEQQKETPIVQLYYLAYQALTEPEEQDYYFALKTCFQQHRTLLPQVESRGILLMIINYAIKKSHTGDLLYIQEALDHYKLGLESHLLLEQGLLSQFTYKNIVALSLKMKDFEWTAAFIDNYTTFLPIALQENYSLYASAKLHFALQNHSKCMELLSQIDYDDLFMNIDSKMMLLKIYYEEKSFDALEDLIHSFTLFLQRKDVLSYHKNNYLNILRFTKRLLKTADFAQQNRQKLRLEIEQTNPLTERAWLLEQL